MSRQLVNLLTQFVAFHSISHHTGIAILLLNIIICVYLHTYVQIQSVVGKKDLALNALLAVYAPGI